MTNWFGSEWLLYGGIGMMILAVSLTAICIVIFILTGKKIRKKLEEEYGKPRH